MTEPTPPPDDPDDGLTATERTIRTIRVDERRQVRDELLGLIDLMGTSVQNLDSDALADLLVVHDAWLRGGATLVRALAFWIAPNEATDD